MWAIYLTCLSLSFPICNRPPPLLRQLWGFSGAWPRWNFTSCSRQSNGLKVVHIRISRTCECVSLCGKRVSACVIKLRIWRLAWVIWGRRCNPRFPYEGKREAGDRTTVREREIWRRRQRFAWYHCWLRRQRKRLKPRSAVTSISWERGKETDSPLETLRGMQPCWPSVLAQREQILDFWPPVCEMCRF